jgi:hypothetical protein
MYEYICAAIVWSNETETFRVVKPLNCTCSHVQKTSNINIKNITNLTLHNSVGRYWSTENVLNNIVILFNKGNMQEHRIQYSARVYKNELSYTILNL